MVVVEDVDHLRELVGELGANLRILGEALGVEIAQRGTELRIRGGSSAQAAVILEHLRSLVGEGFPIEARDVGDAVRILAADPEADLGTYFGDVVLQGVDRRPIKPRSAGQRRYLAALRRYPVVFGVGPAGTGKTYLAVAVAVAALLRGECKRIILTRPAVEAGEKLGFLPGDLTEKVDPYLRPLYDAMEEMIPQDRIGRLLERRVIEVAPLAFMRGRTLQDAWVILDEAQNTTAAQMKMFLTRLGDRSRMAITGDDTQVDLPRGHRSGLVDALRVLGDVGGLTTVRLSAADVVRHPLVAAIIDAYETAARGRRKKDAEVVALESSGSAPRESRG